jgi:hypothetical protein
MKQNVIIVKQGNVIAGALWMLLISLLLFWLPVAGPLIAGFVGGKKAGGVGAAILAVFLPAIALSLFCFVFATVLTGLPLIGVAAGTGGFFLSATGVGLLLLGAIFGGLAFSDVRVCRQ